MSPPLLCTVRGCARPLRADGPALRCDAGHAFDRAREGYWNLLQPQDRKSLRAGDEEDVLAARRRWLERGFASGLVALLNETADALETPEGALAIDIGCGEGTMTSALLGRDALVTCGIDLSTAGIRMASRLAPAVTWVVANADRGLPLADGSVALALSIFGRRPAVELARVLAPSGRAIVVVPGEDDLIELREAAQGQGARRDRMTEALVELAPHLELAARTRWTARAHHDRDAIADALAMGYRGARDAERKRWAGLAALEVTLAAEIAVLRIR